MKRILTSSLLSSAVLSLTALLAVDAHAVGTRRVAFRTGSDFSDGKLEGVAVDSAGRVRAGLSLGNVPVSNATSVWALLDLGKGKRLLATGNEGKLFEVEGGKAKEVAKSGALVLTSLVRAWKGTVLAGSMPEGKLYEYKDGKLSEWLTLPETKHVFGLVFDDKAQVLYAATGPEGRLFRITADKKAQVHFDAPEQHLASLALSSRGILVGTGDKGKLYEVTGPGRASVLHDFGRTEVRAIAVAPSGDIFAIANDIKGQKIPPDNNATSSAKGSGVLYRFEAGTVPEQLLDNDSEYFVSLSLDEKGQPYVGTGLEGKVYTVDDNHNSALIADVEERQVSALVFAGAERMLVTSDPIVIHPIRPAGADDATWTSKVIDAGLRAHFGRLSWIAEGRVEFETRSGNASEPDDTWSGWSKPLTTEGDIESPPARFLQLRARFRLDKQAVLREVVVPFRTDNLRAVVTSIEAQTGASKFLASPDGKLVASGGPLTGRPDDEVELSWNVENPDKDELRYRLEYRPIDGANWFSLTEPHEKLTKASYTWKTRDLPEGKYRVRVSVSDELSNPPPLVKRHQLESQVITLDNTPPRLEGIAVQGRHVRVVAKDGVGPVVRLEAAIAGSDDWVPFAPLDGVFDEAEEQFDLDLSAVSPQGPALITLRLYDQQNNQVVQSVTLR